MTVPAGVVKNTAIVYVRVELSAFVAVPVADHPSAVLSQAVMVTFLRAASSLGTCVGAAT